MKTRNRIRSAMPFVGTALVIVAGLGIALPLNGTALADEMAHGVSAEEQLGLPDDAEVVDAHTSNKSAAARKAYQQVVTSRRYYSDYRNATGWASSYDYWSYSLADVNRDGIEELIVRGCWRGNLAYNNACALFYRYDPVTKTARYVDYTDLWGTIRYCPSHGVLSYYSMRPGYGYKGDHKKLTNSGLKDTTCCNDDFVEMNPSPSTRPVSSASPAFVDVPNTAWYADYVQKAACAGLMTGLKSGDTFTGCFAPEASLTRAEVATVLWRIAGSPSSNGSVLPDVKNHWSKNAVAWCSSKGIITGYTSGKYKGKFRPDAPVTREELATMVYRFAKSQGYYVSYPSTTKYYATGDYRSVSSWAVVPLQWCSSRGIITGVEGVASKPMLQPYGNATRGQAAKVFVVLYESFMGNKITTYAMSGEDSEAVQDAESTELVFLPVDSFGDEEISADMKPVVDADDKATDDGSHGAAADESGGDIVREEAEAGLSQVSFGMTQDGCSYAVVPENAVDGDGAPYVLNALYSELGGRYVGPGVYITSYKGSSADLVLPAQIDGVDVVSANLAWHGDVESGTSDPDGRTRLASLTVERGCGLVSLIASGNQLAEITLAGDESSGCLSALRFAELSYNSFVEFDPAIMPTLEELSLNGCPLSAGTFQNLSGWHGVSGLAANLADVESESTPVEQPLEPDNSLDTPAEPTADKPGVDNSTDDVMDSVTESVPSESVNQGFPSESDDSSEDFGDSQDTASEAEPSATPEESADLIDASQPSNSNLNDDAKEDVANTASGEGEA